MSNAAPKIVKIIGHTKHVGAIQQALDFLLQDFPNEYRQIVALIRKISIIDDPSSSENQVYPKTGHYVLHSGLLRGYPQITEHVASLLIHEAHHVAQHNKGIRNIDSRAERSAYVRQLSFLKRIKSKYLYEHVRDHYNETYAKGTRKARL